MTDTSVVLGHQRRGPARHRHHHRRHQPCQVVIGVGEGHAERRRSVGAGTAHTCVVKTDGTMVVLGPQ